MYCKCGCGKITPVAKRNRKWLGHIKGKHIEYLFGHALRGRKRPPFSKRWKENISNSCKGRIPWNKGLKWPKEIIEKLRGNRDCILGNKNPNWKGGIDQKIRGLRRSREYLKWKRIIFERDKVCMMCGSNKKLSADHIKSFTYYPELRYDPANGRLLCWRCHLKTSNFGRKAVKEMMNSA